LVSNLNKLSWVSRLLGLSVPWDNRSRRGPWVIKCLLCNQEIKVRWLVRKLICLWDSKVFSLGSTLQVLGLSSNIHSSSKVRWDRLNSQDSVLLPLALNNKCNILLSNWDPNMATVRL